jgi:hypothetical protein
MRRGVLCGGEMDKKGNLFGVGEVDEKGKFL